MPEPNFPSDQEKPNYHFELFVVRVWREALNDHFEWRGQVLHSGSGAERYFRDWNALIVFMQEILPGDIPATTDIL